jgi:hypothetical protein
MTYNNKEKETKAIVWSPEKFNNKSVVIKGDFKKPFFFIWGFDKASSEERAIELCDFLNNDQRYRWINNLNRLNESVMYNNEDKIAISAGGPDSRIIDMLEGKIKNETIYFDLDTGE